MEGEKVLLRVSPMKGMMWFGKKDVEPEFVGQFEILERAGEVAYMLALSPNLEGVHPVYDVTILVCMFGLEPEGLGMGAQFAFAACVLELQWSQLRIRVRNCGTCSCVKEGKNWT
uniref:Tf2-1-like SH3-like domain-containing protein n=1 Tax=Nicotiana tabacum TaxID=4097 RepID=A0A1S4B3Z9_TOBAC|nr:PREDICTED: uncharacterized protein LOC107804236 [Nicotiana tabacum]